MSDQDLKKGQTIPYKIVPQFANLSNITMISSMSSRASFPSLLSVAQVNSGTLRPQTQPS